MKLYRIQAKWNDIYYDENIEAENDKAALDSFYNKYESGQLTEKDAGGFLTRDFLFLTLEEVKRDGTTKVNLGETSVGVQMGGTSAVAGQSNS
jgi:hypothetical protein|tara:strand:- start:2037 stop:2315 length:279 start_codon:yes stop_codon:yes gene_type:complete